MTDSHAEIVMREGDRQVDHASAFIAQQLGARALELCQNSPESGDIFLQDIQSISDITKARSVEMMAMGYSKNGASVMTVEYVNVDGSKGHMPVIFKYLHGDDFVREQAVLRRLARTGSVDMVRPVFAIGDEKGKGGYVATEVIPHLLPISKRLRLAFEQSPDPEVVLADVEDMMMRGSIALLQAHRRGIHHRDAQPKNVGIDSETGRSYAYDFELSELQSDQKPVDRDQSMHEIREFLTVSMFYIKYGHFPDDLEADVNINASSYQRAQMSRLQSLSLSSSDFLHIVRGVEARIQSFYDTFSESSDSWNTQMDRWAEEVLLSSDNQQIRTSSG